MTSSCVRQKACICRFAASAASKAARGGVNEEDDLATLTSMAAATALKHSLAKGHLDALGATQSSLMEQSDQTQLLQAKRERVASTRAQVDEIRRQIDADEARAGKILRPIRYG